MLITLLTAGTRGDTEPYVALGVALKNAGFTVRVAAFENFEDFVKSYGLHYYPLNADISQIATSSEAGNARNADNPLKFVLSVNAAKFRPLLEKLQEDLFNACIGSDALVYHPGAIIGFFVAKQFNIPGFLASPFNMAPTREYPSLLFYNFPNLGKGFNLLTHKVFERMMWTVAGGAIKKFWQKQFGKLPDGFSNPFFAHHSEFFPELISCSSHVFPTPSDWPENVYNTGYWFLDSPGSWSAPAGLADFISAGKPPVYAGFGSTGDKGRALEMTELLIESLRLSGQRGVLAAGWQGLTKINGAGEEVFFIDSAPHSWLFPKMSAVIHHGGAGTTAAGFRAGVPQVIVPSGNDQFAWGKRVNELGAGPLPVSRKKLTAAGLSKVINEALENGVNETAVALGKKIRQEDGAGKAVSIIAQRVKEFYS